LRRIVAIVLLALATIIATGFQATHPTPAAPSQSPPTVPNQHSDPAPKSANPGAFISNSKINASIPNYRFPEGQTFTYSVEWRLVTAGKATLRLDKVNGEHHVVLDADSTGAVALLYHVRDLHETFTIPRRTVRSLLSSTRKKAFAESTPRSAMSMDARRQW